MIEKTKLPTEIVEGNFVEKQTLKGIDEIQHLHVAPHSSIKLHDHDNQWEVWILFSPVKRAYICLKGETHEFVNNSKEEQHAMAIKGHLDYSYEDLTDIFQNLNFEVYHGSILIEG